MTRHYSQTDQLLSTLTDGLATLYAEPKAHRENPANTVPNTIPCVTAQTPSSITPTPCVEPPTPCVEPTTPCVEPTTPCVEPTTPCVEPPTPCSDTGPRRSGAKPLGPVSEHGVEKKKHGVEKKKHEVEKKKHEVEKKHGVEKKHEGVKTKEPLSEADRKLSAGLMRIDHVGEVCAQGLYQGQALGASTPKVAETMRQAAQEEEDHLAWCAQRLKELNSHRSLLNPVWYLGSLALGWVAGKAGDHWSLGFVVETETQVTQHLDEHLERLPKNDARSRAILEQMREDEQAHATAAMAAGAKNLPPWIKHGMRSLSKVMTTLAFWV